MATANDDDGNDNIDEIVQDHDNFGTDENEDSMDSIMELADDNKPSDIRELQYHEIIYLNCELSIVTTVLIGCRHNFG